MRQIIPEIFGMILVSFAALNTHAALPGDIAAAAGTPLVAAHSMSRALYSTYNGNLFQVRRASDSKTLDIGVTGPGGYTNMAALTSFASGTACTVAKLYDQSGNANHLIQDNPYNQMQLAYWSISNGTLVPMAVTYLWQWLRNRNNTSKIPIGAQPQTEYWVIHGLYANTKCCFDYGNTENPVRAGGAGTMNSLYFGGGDGWSQGAGTGPWLMTDFEVGMFAGPIRGRNPGNPTIIQNLVTGFTKCNGTTSWVMKAGDASAGSLAAIYDGPLPDGYNPLHQEGGLSLGEGGDGSNSSSGAFFEGVVIAAVTSNTTDSLIQANIASVYGTNRSGSFSPAMDPSLKAWWDGNDTSTMVLGGVTSAGSKPVQTWTDKSSHGYTATQATAANRPTYFAHMLNGKGGLRFTRANNNIFTSTDNDNLFSTGFAIYYVVQPLSAPSSSQSVLAQSTSTSGAPGLGFSVADTNAPALAISDFGSSATGSASLKNTSRVPCIDGFISSQGVPATGGSLKATPYLNGTAGSVLTQNIRAYTATGLTIGSTRFNSPFDGYLYEIVVSSDTTAVTRQKYEGYFAAKYGLLGFLPAGHPYRDPAALLINSMEPNTRAPDDFRLLSAHQTGPGLVLSVTGERICKAELFDARGVRIAMTTGSKILSLGLEGPRGPGFFILKLTWRTCTLSSRILIL